MRPKKKPSKKPPNQQTSAPPATCRDELYVVEWLYRISLGVSLAATLTAGQVITKLGGELPLIGRKVNYPEGIILGFMVLALMVACISGLVVAYRRLTRRKDFPNILFGKEEGSSRRLREAGFLVGVVPAWLVSGVLFALMIVQLDIRRFDGRKPISSSWDVFLLPGDWSEVSALRWYGNGVMGPQAYPGVGPVLFAICFVGLGVWAAVLWIKRAKQTTRRQPENS